MLHAPSRTDAGPVVMRPYRSFKGQEGFDFPQDRGVKDAGGVFEVDHWPRVNSTCQPFDSMSAFEFVTAPR